MRGRRPDGRRRCRGSQPMERSMTETKGEDLVLVAGGAGFLGSHLCERLLADGAQVVCLDNLQTGERGNIARAERSSRFEFILADVVHPLPARVTRRRFSRIYNLACA